MTEMGPWRPAERITLIIMIIGVLIALTNLIMTHWPVLARYAQSIVQALLG